jgi:hypothetical protein
MNTLRQKGGLALWRECFRLFKVLLVLVGWPFSILNFWASILNLKDMCFPVPVVMTGQGSLKLLRDIDANIRIDVCMILVSAIVLCVCAVISWRGFLRARPHMTWKWIPDRRG